MAGELDRQLGELSGELRAIIPALRTAAVTLEEHGARLAALETHIAQADKSADAQHGEFKSRLREGDTEFRNLMIAFQLLKQQTEHAVKTIRAEIKAKREESVKLAELREKLTQAANAANAERDGKRWDIMKILSTGAVAFGGALLLKLVSWLWKLFF